MKNDKEKFKGDFKDRIYKFVLQLIKFVDGLTKDNSSQVIGRQLLRSGTSVGANHVEAQAASSKKTLQTFIITPSNLQTSQNFG